MTQVLHANTQLTGLHAFGAQPLPFAPALQIRAFLLERDAGNLLVYSTAELASDADAIEALGGVERHYLNHRHEAMFSSDRPQAPLFVHERERAAVAEKRHVRATFTRRHMLDDDFEAIPIPGHTSGATAYLWDNRERRFLFTGDSVILRDGEWVAAVLDASDRTAYLESLALLRSVEFDVLVPWAATGGQRHYALTDPADAGRRIDAIIERVERGEAA